MDFSTPPVDLIMITYGQSDMCRENIQNIIENTDYPSFTFTVIDNHSLDDTWPEVCKELYRHPQTQGFQTEKNLGYGGACNIGARLTQNPVIVFLNSDIQVKEGHEDWLTHLVDTLLEHDDVAVVGPKLVNKNNQLVGTGVVGTNKDREIRGWMKPDKDQYNTPEEVISVSGAVYAVKREYFNLYGGFYPEYIFYHEEEDFSFKVRQDGLKVAYQPLSVLVHQHRGSCGDSDVLRGYANKSFQVFMRRWGCVMDDPTVYPIPLTKEG